MKCSLSDKQNQFPPGDMWLGFEDMFASLICRRKLHSYGREGVSWAVQKVPFPFSSSLISKKKLKFARKNRKRVIYSHLQHNWGPKNGFQRFLVLVFYCQTVENKWNSPSIILQVGVHCIMVLLIGMHTTHTHFHAYIVNTHNTRRLRERPYFHTSSLVEMFLQ